MEVDHPATSKLTYAGAPIKAEGFFKMRRPAPMLGQHSEEIYGELGYSTVYAVCKSDTFWPTYLHPGLNWWRYSYIWGAKTRLHWVGAATKHSRKAISWRDIGTSPLSIV